MAQCLTPIDIRIPKTNKIIAVPCGKCYTCLMRKGSEWSFRLMQEEKICHSAHFITFTYDNQHVPVTGKNKMGLQKSHLQDFFKRLRSAASYELKALESRTYPLYARERFQRRAELLSQPIRYYAVGEYGGKSKRPHYHAIIFNADIELILRSWQMGDIHRGEVNESSVGYCMKYMLKKGFIPTHEGDDRLPEFALMSKGLGASYITDQNMWWHHQSYDRLYVTAAGGVKLSMPRYYKERLVDSGWRARAGAIQLSRMENDRYKFLLNTDGDIIEVQDKYPDNELVRIHANELSKTQKHYLLSKIETL